MDDSNITVHYLFRIRFERFITWPRQLLLTWSFLITHNQCLTQTQTALLVPVSQGTGNLSRTSNNIDQARWN